MTSKNVQNWNHQLQANGFTAKFSTFYGVISMVYKSVDHGKFWSIFFYHGYFYTKDQKQENQHCVTCYVISMVCTVIDHSCRPISAQGFAQLLKISFVLVFAASIITTIPFLSQIIYTKLLHPIHITYARNS